MSSSATKGKLGGQGSFASDKPGTPGSLAGGDTKKQPAAAFLPKFPKKPIDYETVSRYNHAGVSYLAEGKPEQAIEWFDRALAIQSDCSQSYVGRGMAETMLKAYERAEEDFNKALSLNPSFAGAYIELARLKIETGDVDAALLFFSKAIELDSGSFAAHYNRALCWYFYKQDTEGALEDLGMAIRLRPNNALAYALRARIRIARGELALAGMDIQLARDNGFAGKIV